MDDNTIIQLYFARNELALDATSQKYAPYCRKIAMNILKDAQDAEECLNDVFLKLWNNIPPEAPQSFSAYIARLTRNRAIDIYNQKHAQKRIDSQYAASIDELEEIIADSRVADISDLGDALNRFLAGLANEQRKIFVRRYFFCDSIDDIAKFFGISQSKVKTSLFRTRNKLKEYLEKDNLL